MIRNTVTGHEAEVLIYVLLLLLLSITRYSEESRLGLFLRSFTNANLVDQQLRQERAFSRLALLSFVIVLVSTSAFVALTFHHFGLFSDFSFFGLTLFVLVGLILLTTARVALYAFTAWLFELDHLQQQHSFHWLLNNFILSLFLIPASILISFAPSLISTSLIYAGLLVMSVFYGIRILRLASITHSSFHVPVQYNFLYICALEILPPLLVITLISRQIGG
ncbi:MAG: DUF4271 domain-containing protein [Flavobacteriales bacterium]